MALVYLVSSITMQLKILLPLICITLFTGSCKKTLLFEQIPSSHSGIHFNNLITENDTINPIDNAYIYNGGGVGVGDFNNDGLPDLYFTGNMVQNRLYLNEGNFKFRDITAEACVGGNGHWGRGVSVIDINNDGLMDIYISNSLLADSIKRTNQLYINQGLDKNGVPQFREMAHEYGLDLRAHSTMAAFFDYDNDGDLDMYQAVNWPNTASYANNFRPIIIDGSYPSTGRLLQNNWDSKLGHPVFHDVSRQAGINTEGYSHGVTIADINRDGWKDIYVTNDFLSANVLYINNHDGTFTDRSKEYFKHTSFNAMGQDIIDINNDGLADIIELDMNPEDNYRKKMMGMANSYQTFENFDHYGYQYQYVRNTLQLNRGPRLGPNDTIGAPAFSEVSFMAGIAQTDWSWAPLVVDFNNDGFRDLVVTNGYPRDVTDHDFIAFRSNPYLTATKKQILEQIPQVKIHNYAFRNSGGIRFDDVSAGWGLEKPSFSNGGVYVDLNNDGAMDLVVSNIDDEAFVYKNTSRQSAFNATHYLQIRFAGTARNLNGIGAWADIYYNKGLHQVWENSPYRGYLSSVQNIAHFGLKSVSVVDSVVIRWPDLRRQVLRNVKADQTLTVRVEDACDHYSWGHPERAQAALFNEAGSVAGIDYQHRQTEFVDFNIQKLLPHKLSAYSPALAVSDIDGNGLDDLVIGGSQEFPAQVFLQQAGGRFRQRQLIDAVQGGGNFQDGGIVCFDANGDGHPDVCITGSGYAAAPGSAAYQDRLYLNDGKGNFHQATNALPLNNSSKLCVRSVDYNKDGRPDLLVCGRVDPWHYPRAVSCFIYRNDSRNGQVKFTDVTSTVAPALKNIGLVCDAIFSDYDNDGWPDLILAGEWMPVTILHNNHGVFTNITGETGLGAYTGWWNSIVAGDFRHTGKMDYVVGNTGQNSLYQVSETEPASVLAGDFDHRGRFDAFPSLFLPGPDGIKRNYPVNVRDDAIKQLISLRQRFTNYHAYAAVTMDELLTPGQLKDALKLSATELRSVYLKNEGLGKFTETPLPPEAQTSVINGMIAEDFDGDGHTDLVLSGNDFGTDATVGRYDAFNGLFLKGDGKGNFKPLSILESGIYIPGDGKALVELRNGLGSLMIAASQHNERLKVFGLKRPVQIINLWPDDVYALTVNRAGQLTRQEFYSGTSFLSQSGRFMLVTPGAVNVTIFNSDGHSRAIDMNTLNRPR